MRGPILCCGIASTAWIATPPPSSTISGWPSRAGGAVAGARCRISRRNTWPAFTISRAASSVNALPRCLRAPSWYSTTAMRRRATRLSRTFSRGHSTKRRRVPRSSASAAMSRAQRSRAGWPTAVSCMSPPGTSDSTATKLAPSRTSASTARSMCRDCSPRSKAGLRASCSYCEPTRGTSRPSPPVVRSGRSSSISPTRFSPAPTADYANFCCALPFFLRSRRRSHSASRVSRNRQACWKTCTATTSSRSDAPDPARRPLTNTTRCFASSCSPRPGLQWATPPSRRTADRPPRCSKRAAAPKRRSTCASWLPTGLP